jgi:clan AA aspartic protease (TIGR02281 family)
MKKAMVLSLIFWAIFLAKSQADTLYLKNGRSIEGLIKSEDGKIIELEVCQGFIKFDKDEIERIEKSAPPEAQVIRLKWERQIVQAQQRLQKQREEEERMPKKVEFFQAGQGIILNVTLNRKVEASLVLDTGASLIMLRKNMAEKLGINLDKLKPDAKLTLADGRKIDAKHIILESVEAQGVEAENVEAAILLEEVGEINFGDGLLGMSFLGRFNFKVDQKEKKLILEKF